jgi:hypothetical protein
LPIPGQAEDDEGKHFVADVRAKLAQQLNIYSEQSYKKAQPDVVELIARDKPKNFPLQLHAAITYVIVASCDSDCTQVVMALRNPEGLQLTQTPDRYHTVIINGVPNQTGRHSVLVSVPGCKEDDCYVGLMLLRQGPISPNSQTEAPTVASAVMTTPTGPTFRSYDNHDLIGTDLRRTPNSEVNACASACAAEPRCAGYSFDKWNHWCFLKGDIQLFRLEPNTITALRSELAEPALISIPVTIQRYRNKAFPYGGQDTQTAESYEECEGRCAQDGACVALTYFRTNKQCRLMASTGEYFPDARADSAIKRQEPKD